MTAASHGSPTRLVTTMVRRPWPPCRRPARARLAHCSSARRAASRGRGGRLVARWPQGGRAHATRLPRRRGCRTRSSCWTRRRGRCSAGGRCRRCTCTTLCSAALTSSPSTRTAVACSASASRPAQPRLRCLRRRCPCQREGGRRWSTCAAARERRRAPVNGVCSHL